MRGRTGARQPARLPSLIQINAVRRGRRRLGRRRTTPEAGRVIALDRARQRDGPGRMTALLAVLALSMAMLLGPAPAAVQEAGAPEAMAIGAEIGPHNALADLALPVCPAGMVCPAPAVPVAVSAPASRGIAHALAAKGKPGGGRRTLTPAPPPRVV